MAHKVYGSYGEYQPEILEKLHKTQLDMLADFKMVCEKHNINYFAIAGTAIGVVRHQGFIPWDDDIDIAMLRKDYEKFMKFGPEELKDRYEFMGPDMEHKYYNLQPAMVKKGTKLVTETAWAAGLKTGIFLDIFIYENIPDDMDEAMKIIRKTNFYKLLYVIRNVNFFKLVKGGDFSKKLKNIISGILRLFLLLVPNGNDRIYKKYIKYATSYYGKTNTYTALCDPGASFMWVKEDEIYPMVELPYENTTMKMLNKYEAQLKRHMGNYMEIPPENKRTNHCPKELDFGSEA